jgi:membrane protease YdiL (CAAX protease family)
MTISVTAANKTGLKSFVEKHQVSTLILLVYGLTWPFMILEVLASRDLLPFDPPVVFTILQAFMPGLAAVIVAGLVTGGPGIRALLGKYLIAGVGLNWYAFAVFAMAGISIVAILLADLVGGLVAIPLLSPDMPPVSGPLSVFLNILILFVFSILFNTEELAWRGFALPRLQAKHNALISSLVLSIPWLFFHLPLFFKVGSSQSESSFVSYAVGLAGLSVLFTWLCNNTRGSVLLACILHASMNTWTQVFSINSEASNQLLGWMLTVLLVIVAVIVVSVSGAKNLSRTSPRIQE